MKDERAARVDQRGAIADGCSTRVETVCIVGLAGTGVGARLAPDAAGLEPPDLRAGWRSLSRVG